MNETGTAVRFNIKLSFILTTIKLFSFNFKAKFFLSWKLYNSRTTYNSESMWLGRFPCEKLDNLKEVLNTQPVSQLLLLFCC